ncbi:MAG: hypothetical protein Q7R87_02815 [Nanoarchaeota archaeon]|nr:hypothetical protein [Nanoarchaeota archaeon]
MATKNPRYPININSFLKRLKRDHDFSIHYGAMQVWLSITENVFDFDELRTSKELPKYKLEKLSLEGSQFLEKMRAGKFDVYLSQAKYDALHSKTPETKVELPAKLERKTTPKQSLPSPAEPPAYSPPLQPPIAEPLVYVAPTLPQAEQPRPTPPPSNLEKELIMPTTKADDSPTPAYSPSDKKVKDFNLSGLAENLRSSNSIKDKRTGDLLGKLSAKFSVSTLPDLTAKKIGVDDLADQGFDNVERHLLADYLDDHEVKIRPTLRLHPNNLTHRITDDSIKRDVERFVSTHHIDTIEELASISYSDLLQRGLPTEGAMTLSLVLDKHYGVEPGGVKFNESNRPTSVQISTVNPQPSAPSVSQSKPIASTGQTSARPLFASPLPSPKPQPVSEPEADTPLVPNTDYSTLTAPVSKPTQKPVDKSGLPHYILSMSATDVINLMGDRDNQVNMNAALRVLNFPNLEAILKMSRERIANAGATSSAISSYFTELHTQILTPNRTLTQRARLQDEIPKSQPYDKFVDTRGYTVVGSDDRSKIIVNGLELEIVRKDNYETVISLFTKHASGKKPAEIARELDFSQPNVTRWLEKAGVRTRQSQQPAQQIQSPQPENNSPASKDTKPNEKTVYDVTNIGDGKFIVNGREYNVPRDEAGVALPEYIKIAEETLKLHSSGLSDLDISVKSGFNLGRVREILTGAGLVEQREFAEYLEAPKQLVTFNDIMEHQRTRTRSGAYPAPPVNPLSNTPPLGNLTYKIKGKK